MACVSIGLLGYRPDSPLSLGLPQNGRELGRERNREGSTGLVLEQELDSLRILSSLKSSLRLTDTLKQDERKEM
jgi:hypothetical protein